MCVPQTLTKPKVRGWGKGSSREGKPFISHRGERQSKEEMDILRLLFQVVIVINRNNSNTNMKEKNWEEKGGQVVNAITRAGSQYRLFL